MSESLFKILFILQNIRQTGIELYINFCSLTLDALGKREMTFVMYTKYYTDIEVL